MYSVFLKRGVIFIFLVSTLLSITAGCGKTGFLTLLETPPNTRIVDNSADVGYYLDMLIDSKGTPRFSYMEKSGGEIASLLKYADLQISGDWNVEIVDTGDGITQKEGLFSQIIYDERQGVVFIIYREETTGLDYVNTSMKVASKGSLGTWITKYIRSAGDFGEPFMDVGYGISAVQLSDGRIGIAFIEGEPKGDIVFYSVKYMELDSSLSVVLGPEVVRDNINSAGKTNAKTIRDVESRLADGLPLSIDILSGYDQEGSEVIHIFYYNPSGQRAEHAFRRRDEPGNWKYESLDWTMVTGEELNIQEITDASSQVHYVGFLKGRALEDKDRTTLYRNGNPMDPSEWEFYSGGKGIEIVSNYSPFDIYTIDYINTKVGVKEHRGRFIRGAQDSRGRLYAIYENVTRRLGELSVFEPGRWWRQELITAGVQSEGGYSIALDVHDNPVITFYDTRYGNLMVAHKIGGRWYTAPYLSLDFSGVTAIIRSMQNRQLMGIGATIFGAHAGLGGSPGSWVVYIPYYGVSQ